MVARIGPAADAVLLMAWVPVLEQAFGQDRLARIHRLLRFSPFTLDLP
jgi:hypothetical protein